jgi:outer membrane murein-binding lipoprotein Lpp
MFRMTCWCILISLFVIAGCSSDGKLKNDILNKTEEISSLVDQGHWDQIALEINTLHTLYQNQKWKFQFLGDEQEYEGMEREIDKLSAVVKEKDNVQIKLGLAEIESYLNSIYFR